MESSLVFKAKTAFHSAAAKAERVLTEIKADFKQDFGRPSSANSSIPSGTEAKAGLPRINNVKHEVCQKEEIQNPVLDVSKGSMLPWNKQMEETTLEEPSAIKSAEDVPESDENSQNERFKHVPKKMREQEFWRRYFTSVKQAKKETSEKDRKQVLCIAPLSLDEASCQNNAAANLEMESPKKDPIEEEAYANAFTMVAIPPTVIVRQLASAIETGRSFKSMQELAMPNKDPSQGNDWSGFVPSFSAMKMLSLREKDEKLRLQLGIDGGNHSLLWSLFDADTQYSKKKSNDGSLLSSKAHLPGDIHGAPPGGFVVQLAEIMAGIKTEQKMAEFWLEVVRELRKLWDEGQPIPWLPVDDNPDLQYCLLHQQLQLINCCIARKKRRLAALKSLDSVKAQGLDENEALVTPPNQQTCVPNSSTYPSALYVKVNREELVPRLGVQCPADNLTMLETGEPVFSPITQEGPVLTEELIRETEELILRTGSVGAGCSQLFSDMQAFKAANPGCILEDFVRWYSPPDWREEMEESNLSTKPNDSEDGSSRRGHLSTRMQSEGNLWRELWESAKPIPAAKQTPLFDEELAGESTLSYLEDIAPSDLFEQLFIAALSLGFAIAEAAPATNKDLTSKWFRECKEYVISTCCRDMDTETLEHLCQVYETMEAIVVRPHEDIFSKSCESTNIENAIAEAPKGRLEKIGIHSVHLPSIEMHIFKKHVQEQKVQTAKDDSHHSLLSRFFEGKNSLFGKKPPKPTFIEHDKKMGASENEWTIL